MKKKGIVLLLLLCMISITCFSQRIEWKLIQDSNVYQSDAFSNYSFFKELKKGSIINGSKTFISTYNSPEYTYLITFDDEYYTDAEAVIPKGTKDLLDGTLLTSTLHRQGKTLFSSTYLEMIKSQNRNSALQIVPEGVGWYIKNMDEYSGPWWKPSQTIVVNSNIFQTIVDLDNFYNWATFYITDIKKNGHKYELQVICDNWYMHDSLIPHSEQPKQGDEVYYPTKLTLYADGGYIDIFYKDMYLLGSYAIVDADFGSVFEEFIETNYCDLTNVTFPRRADKNHSVGTSCIVAENLRLRKEESTSSATLHTMKAGTQLKILQLGKQQTIDGITANWVQVQLADGQNTRGWCFGGYLLEH